MVEVTRDRPSILETTDTFIAVVPWSSHRVVLVWRRQHGGREYVRLRTWNRHRQKAWWYPTDRAFVVPVDNANVLANAIKAAARGEPHEAGVTGLVTPTGTTLVPTG